MSVQQKNQTEKNNKMAEIDDQILRSFDIKKRLGKGAYGIVWKALDKKTQQTVAVKKIFDAFRNETDAQRTFREIMFLRAFRNHPNIVQLHSIHRALNNVDIYLSFEFMESDLHNVIKRGSILKDIHKRFVMYQLLNATQYIHSGNVIHRDMKPSNVLVDSKCRCKIADFGLARSIGQQHPNPSSNAATPDVPDEPCLTDYVATRWYRAPEILVASKKYTMGIDMWSLGCILGEMIRAKPLFPGSCTMNQIERIVAAMPHITDRDVQSIGGGFGTALLTTKSAIGAHNPTLDDLLLGSPDDARDLVQSLLVLDPMRRLTAKQALGHRYIEKFRNTSPECELNADIVPPFRDDVQLTVSEYRSKLYEIMSAHEKNGYVGKRLDKKDQQLLESTLTVQPSMHATSTPPNPSSISRNKNLQYASRPNGGVQQSLQSASNYRLSTNTSTASKQQHSSSNVRPQIAPPKNGASCPNAYARAVAVSHPTRAPRNAFTNSYTTSASNLIADDVARTTAPPPQQRRGVNHHHNYECLDDTLFRATAQRLRSSAAVIAGGVGGGGHEHHRRNHSLDTFSTGKLLAKTMTTGNHGVAEPTGAERRRQSLVDADPPPIKQIRETGPPPSHHQSCDKRLHQDACTVRLVPSMSKHKLLSVLNARAKAAGAPPAKPPRSSNILCFKAASPQSPPNDGAPPRVSDDTNFDSRLRVLEERVRKHNQSVAPTTSTNLEHQFKSVTTRHPRNLPLPSHSDPTVASTIERPPASLCRTRSGNTAAGKLQHRPSRLLLNRYQMTDLGGSGDHAGAQTRAFSAAQQPHQQHHPRLGINGNSNSNTNNNNAPSNSNYGVVRATDFFKLRSSEVTS